MAHCGFFLACLCSVSVSTALMVFLKEDRNSAVMLRGCVTNLVGAAC